METNDQSSPAWQPLSSIERRILGVLVEKAKTTPENYPLSLNAIRVGANQKSNRSPQMHLDDDQIELALDSLRQQGVVTEIQGDGRVAKYRHMAYEWLGTDKVELAVVTELLLRGDQTLGELRGRSSRMEPIPDLSALRPVLASLEQKGLLLYLTPPGRGCTVTHALYQPQEIDKLRGKFGPAPAAASPPPFAQQSPVSPQAAAPQNVSTGDDELRVEVASLREEVQLLRDEIAQLRTSLGD